MSKRKIGGVMASVFIAGALVCGRIFASGNQATRAAEGYPYQDVSSHCAEGSRIVSYGLKTKELKVLTGDFATAFDPCTYWDGKKFTFAGVHKKGGGCQIWEMNADGSGLRQMTDYKGTCRAPIYYAA